MVIKFGWSLKLWRSSMYIIITMFTIFFILLPFSIITYMQFQSSIIPTSPMPMKLQFQYMKMSGPYAFFNITESSNDIIKPWKQANTNYFTKIEQVLTVYLKYVKLTPGSTVGGVRVSIYDDMRVPVLHIPKQSQHESIVTLPDSRRWPFRPISLSDKDNDFKLYRADQTFKSWKDIVGKSYSKSVPFINDLGLLEKRVETVRLLDYFLPKWILNMFIPAGIQNLLTFDNIKNLLGRSEKLESSFEQNKYLKTLDLLDSYGDFQDFQAKSFSTGLVMFEGELQEKEFKGTNLLVELDMNDIFVIDSNIKLEYVLHGIRWWVYWWPGLCFLIGVGFIWYVSCFGFILVSWFGQTLWRFYFKALSNDNKKKRDKVKLTSSEVLKEEYSTNIGSA